MIYEEKLFDVDYSKVLYKMTIEVCENGIKFMCTDVAEGYTLNYHNVIGSLECLKQTLIERQSAKNVASVRPKQTPIEDFVANNDMSMRLHKALIENKDIFPFAERITKKQLLKIMGVGRLTWIECERLLKEKGVKPC